MKKHPIIIAICIALVTLMSVSAFAAPTPVNSFDSAKDMAVSSVVELSSVTLEGNGTQQSPYLVSDSTEYFAFCEKVNGGENTAFVKLTEDIDFGGATLVPIGNVDAPFKGCFDGNGKTLNNFKLSGAEYIGVFGCVELAQIKNLYIGSFSVDLTQSTAEKVYVGTIAYAKNSTITKLCVNNESFSLTGQTKYVYVGAVCGYAESNSKGKMLLQDCYSICDITLVNSNGYAYMGGMVGRFVTESGGNSRINHCYNVGKMSGTSYNSTNIGGLVGYLYSHGSAYSPEVGALSAEDSDIMIENSFATADIYAQSTGYNTNAGKVVGSINNYADVEKSTTFYSNESSIKLAGKKNKEHRCGTSTIPANLQSTDGVLVTAMEFDFDNTWTLLTESTYKYPTFKKYEKAFEQDQTIIFRPVSSDVTINSNGNTLTVDTVRFADGHTLTLDRGTYIFNSVEGKPIIKADANANIIINGTIKPANYVELDIKDAAIGNVRYAEVNGKQYEIKTNGAKYGLIVEQPTLVEIVEKTSGGTSVGTSKYFLAMPDGTAKDLSSMNDVIKATDSYSIRLDEKTGIRFKATADALKKAHEQDYKIVEYGYILTLRKHLDAKSDSHLNFDFDKIVKGVAYDVKDGTDIVFYHHDEFDDFTAVLYDIPKNGYKEEVVAKTYTKVMVDSVEYVIYGEEMSNSLYNVANALDKDTLNDEQKTVVDEILKA